MTQIEEQAGTPAAQESEGLEVRVARELLERAKAEGVSLVGPGGLLAGVTKTVLQAALDAEMADHLGYEKGERPAFPAGNHRNGTSPKTVLTEVGAIPLEVPRDRNGKLRACDRAPGTRGGWRGFNQAIVSLYAKGLTTGEIRAHLGEMYGVEVSRDLISRVTGKVAGELASWQSRPLDSVYPVLLIDAIFVKIRVLSLIMWRGGSILLPVFHDHVLGALLSGSCCRICRRCVWSGCGGSRTGWCSRPGSGRRQRLARVAGRCRGGCMAATCASCAMPRPAACRS